MDKLTFRNGSVSVGDIFASAWGYEQTNVNFYQVILLHGKKTVTVRKIRGDYKYNAAMSGEVKPVINNFISEPLKRQVKDYSECPLISIDTVEDAYKSDENESLYFSRYA